MVIVLYATGYGANGGQNDSSIRFINVVSHVFYLCTVMVGSLSEGILLSRQTETSKK